MDPEKDRGASRPGGDVVERLLADLEQQAHGLHLRERDDDVAGLLPAEYARVELEARVHASVGRRVAVRTRVGVRVEGVLEQAGRGWFAVAGDAREWVLPLAGVLALSGLGERSLVEDARPVTGRLGPGAPLRELADRGARCLCWLADSTRLEGRVRRVGADFVEVQGTGAPEVVPFSALVAIAAERV
ncbi:MAG: hypothetical protein ACTHNS_16075 [Marmoricola sp.]